MSKFCQTLLNTSQGKIIGIFNEYAYLGKGSSIHSSGQLEWFKTNVDEKSVKVGGTQLITTLDGYSVPFLIKDGSAYATSLGRPTDQDMDTYPHVFFTSPDEWDPSVLDHDSPHPDGLDPSQVPDQPFGDPMFDACGDFNKHIIANLNTLLDAPPGECGSYTEISSVFTANLHQSSPQEPDWNALHPFFAWTSPWNQIFPLPPKIKIPNSHIVRYICQFEQYLSHKQNEHRAHPCWAPTKEPTMSCWRYTPTPKQDRFQDLLEAICPNFLHTTLTK